MSISREHASEIWHILYHIYNVPYCTHNVPYFTYKCLPLYLVGPVSLRSLKYCDERVISCCALQRTALEQELGLAAYLVCVEEQRQDGPRVSSDLSESDPDKLSSTDNEEEEPVADGQLRAPPQQHKLIVSLNIILSILCVGLGFKIERAIIFTSMYSFVWSSN